MLNKTILSPVTQAGAERKTLSVEKPQTQTVEAVKALLSWRGRASDPLPMVALVLADHLLRQRSATVTAECRTPIDTLYFLPDPGKLYRKQKNRPLASYCFLGPFAS